MKQFSGIERCQARSRRAQRDHIGLTLRAFLRLEVHGYQQGMSWFEASINQGSGAGLSGQPALHSLTNCVTLNINHYIKE
jgi:hypothetical protein